MARSIKQVLNDPTLADLAGDDLYGILDRIDSTVAKAAMVESRSAVRPSLRESKPIGKKHYRKTIRRDGVLYVANGLIDEKGMMTYFPINTGHI